MSGFIAGLVIGGMLSNGSDPPPQITTYQTPPNAIAVLCEHPIDGGVSCIPQFDVIPIEKYACTKLTLQNKSCKDYYISNRYLIFYNGSLHSILIEFTRVKKE